MHDHAASVLSDDPVMARLVETHGPVDVTPAEDEFERLCTSIINQQLSTASARAVRERAFAALGDVTPESVLAADEDALREAGLSRTKVEYVREAARAFRERDLTREGLADATDAEVVEELTRIRGVGEWTAHMYLMFVLGREDVLPLGDLAIRRGIERLYGDADDRVASDGGDDGMTRAEMSEIAERWRPYRSIAARYIWLDYEAE